MRINAPNFSVIQMYSAPAEGSSYRALRVGSQQGRGLCDTVDICECCPRVPWVGQEHSFTDRYAWLHLTHPQTPICFPGVGVEP